MRINLLSWYNDYYNNSRVKDGYKWKKKNKNRKKCEMRQFHDDKLTKIFVKIKGKKHKGW